MTPIHNINSSNAIAPTPLRRAEQTDPEGPLAARVSAAPPAHAKKANAAAKTWIRPWMLYPPAAVVLLWAALNCFWTALCRLYVYFHHKSFYDDVEKAQIQSVSESLKIAISGTNRGEKVDTAPRPTAGQLRDDLLAKCGSAPTDAVVKQAAEIADGAVRIRDKIEKLERGDFVWSGIEGIKDDLRALMGIELYQKLKDEDCQAINFLQFVTVKLVAVDGTEALRNYGKRCLGKEFEGRTVSPSELGEEITKYLGKFSFNYDNGRVLHAAAHPLLTIHSMHSYFDPLGYTATKGNPNFSAHTFELDGKKITFYYGPGPTGDPVFEHGLLSAYRKFGLFELRFNLQDTIKPHDYHRVQEMRRIGDENPGVLRHAVLGFDTKMQQDKSLLVGFNTPEEFFLRYRKFVKEGIREIHAPKRDNGFYISHELMSDEQVDTALSKAQEFCETLSRGNPLWEAAMLEVAPDTGLKSIGHRWASFTGDQVKADWLKYPGKVRMAKMMQLIADAYLSLGMLYGSFDSITPEMAQRFLDEKIDRDLRLCRTSGACKQNVDRGTMENIVLKLFFRWATDPSPLKADEAYEIAGAITGRGRIVDNRNIMKKRFRILDDLFRFVDKAPPAIAFVPTQDKKNPLLRLPRVRTPGGVARAHDLLKDYRKAITLPPATVSNTSWFFTKIGSLFSSNTASG